MNKELTTTALFVMDNSIAENRLKWLEEVHFSDKFETGCFTKHSTVKVDTTTKGNERKTIVVFTDYTTEELREKYLNEFRKEISEDFMKNCGREIELKSLKVFQCTGEEKLLIY